jgi:hypothetical protein
MDKLQSNYSSDEEQNLCIECGIDMGPMNPRQLCGKWQCLNNTYIFEDDEKINNDEPICKKAKN